ncbi:glycine--tRNA ligase, partial [Bifidobacterium longum]
MAQSKLDEVVSLAKRRGFVFPAGEIYGGTRSAWDYGPLGVALKDNIKREWWRSMVVTRPDVVGVDTSIILPPEVWVASGHVSVFNDPLVECLNCHKRNRADKLEESYAEKHGDKMPENGMKDIVCPNCGTRGQWTEPRDFNMMLRTHLGPVEDENSLHYVRPET